VAFVALAAHSGALTGGFFVTYKHVCAARPALDLSGGVAVGDIRPKRGVNGHSFSMELIALFAVTALVLAALGIDGAISYMVMSGVLYAVSATDPLSFGTVCAALTAVAIVACYFPARRALMIDALVASRT
jgi:hypothetical protein